MTLRLSLENVDRLPDGGPVSVEVKTGRGLDIGRDPYLDWTLPDPSRHVSGKHCEIRFRDGGYWLHDVSTNGTFVNGADYRVPAPHQLRGGDRLAIGPYIIRVEIAGASAPARPAASGAAPAATSADDDIWRPVGEPAPPAERESFRPRKAQRAPADFLDFPAPLATLDPEPAPPPPGGDEDAWLRGPARPIPVAPPPPPPIVTPSPRRPAVRAPAEEEPGSTLAAPPPTQAPAKSPEEGSRTLTRIAIAAGLPEDIFAGRDADALAAEIGAVLRLTATHLGQMLRSRAQTKSAIRSSSHTMFQSSQENNPLKFTGTAEEALAIMFGPRVRQFLDAPATIDKSFRDLESHQLLTFESMQSALEALFQELSPQRIDATVESDRGLGALVGSRKAKLWDTFAERWRAASKRSDGA